MNRIHRIFVLLLALTLSFAVNARLVRTVRDVAEALTARSYCGPHIYLNGRHERMLTDCGYILNGEPHYYVKDYQGNVRAVLNSAHATVETNSYYPYGALMATTGTQSTQPYKYGTKELDRENGLNLYNSHARHYTWCANLRQIKEV